MTDIYEVRVQELAAEIFYKIEDPYGAVLPKEMMSKFDLMKRLASENIKAHQIRIRQIELPLDFIPWVRKIIADKYINQIANADRRHNPENILYNIVYCVLERFGIRGKCDKRSRLISYDMFCTLFNKNRKTLSRGCTLIYTAERIREIWITEDTGPDNSWPALRNIITSIFNDIYSKFLTLN